MVHWNRDGVVDWQDGWRRLDDSWAVGTWDSAYRGEGWRPETVSVREVPSGFYEDTTWTNVEGPWDSFGWGGAVVADWNRDGVIDWKDDLAWRGVGVGGTELVSVREVTAPGAATTFGGPVSTVRGAPVSTVRATTAAAVPVTTTTSTVKPAATTTRTTTATTSSRR